MTFLLGLWLIMSPVVLAYGMGGARITSRMSEVLVGAFVVVVSLVGMMAPRDAPWAGAVLVATGAWIASAPLVLVRGDGAAPSYVLINAWAVGGAVAVLGGTAAFLLWRTR